MQNQSILQICLAPLYQRNYCPQPPPSLPVGVAVVLCLLVPVGDGVQGGGGDGGRPADDGAVFLLDVLQLACRPPAEVRYGVVRTVTWANISSSRGN